MPSPSTYFTKLCEQDGIAVNHPPDMWFVKRHLKEPKTKSAKLEVAAAHAWAYAHQHGTATGHDTTGWNVLPQVHLKYLISVCEHPFPLDGEEPRASAARYLELVRPLVMMPEDAALAAAALAAAAALPPNPLLGQAVPGVMLGIAGPLTATAALSSTLLPAQSLAGAALVSAGPSVANRSRLSTAADIAASGNLRPEIAAALNNSSFASISDEVLESLTPEAARSLLARARSTAASALPVVAAAGSSAGAMAASARKRKADFIVHEHSVLWSLLPFTYGEIKHALGPNLNQKLSNMGAWSEKDKNTYREKVMPFMVGGLETQAYGYDERPPYTFMTSLNMPLPDSSKTVDTSKFYGELVATVARYRSVEEDTQAYGSKATKDRKDQQEYWDALCKEVAMGVEVPFSRITPVLNVVRGYYKDRTENLGTSFKECGLLELVPFLAQQQLDLDKLLENRLNQITAMLPASGPERAQIWNMEWTELLHPFFRDIMRFDAAHATPARLAAVMAIANTSAPAASTLIHAQAQSSALGASPYISTGFSSPYPMGLNPFPGHFGVPPPQYVPSPKPAQQPARGLTTGGQGGSTHLYSTPHASGRSAPFMGLPASAEVIGPKLAVWRGPVGNQVCRACGPTACHSAWECPVRYATVFGAPCPGFTAAGDRVASDWSGPDLTAKACAAWKVFSTVHALVCARPVPGPPAF